MPTLHRIPAPYRPYVEAELKRIAFEIQQDEYERLNGARLAPKERLVPDAQYDATATGEDLIVLVTEHRTTVARTMKDLLRESA